MVEKDGEGGGRSFKKLELERTESVHDSTGIYSVVYFDLFLGEPLFVCVAERMSGFS